MFAGRLLEGLETSWVWNPRLKVAGSMIRPLIRWAGVLDQFTRRWDVSRAKDTIRPQRRPAGSCNTLNDAASDSSCPHGVLIYSHGTQHKLCQHSPYPYRPEWQLT